MGDHAPGRRRLTGTGPGADDLEQVASDIFPPRTFDPALVETGRRLFAGEARFVAGALEPSALPAERLPEIAFAGRSNVGKSSLINALTGRRVLARTSNTPGRTRQINLFELGGRLVLVDLPGYGYAEAPKVAVRIWTGFVRRYLQSRAALRRVCLLIDARHGIKQVDRPLMGMLDDAGASFQIVLTKIDKAGAGEIASALERLTAELAAHPAAHPEVHLTSAATGRGIPELRQTLADFALGTALRR
jgi:GTP-binding protein